MNTTFSIRRKQEIDFIAMLNKGLEQIQVKFTKTWRLSSKNYLQEYFITKSKYIQLFKITWSNSFTCVVFLSSHQIPSSKICLWSFATNCPLFSKITVWFICSFFKLENLPIYKMDAQIKPLLQLTKNVPLLSEWLKMSEWFENSLKFV